MQHNTQKRSIIICSILLFLVFGSFNQLKTKKEKPLFKLGTKEYYTEEFEYYFSKNNDELTKDSVEFKVKEYLDLFVKFRLKVLEAENRNMHLDETFIKELSGYQKQLAKPYLTESKMSEALIKEVYERMKEEVRASHILLKVKENALPEDTLKVYNKVMQIRSQVVAGANFDSLAQITSEDPSAKQNKGDLGYFSALAMVYPFEEAAFSTSVNDVSNPTRTRFGYHLIKVTDRRKAQGKVKVAHIMLREKKEVNNDVENIELKISSIHQKLSNGESWDELCNLYSEDRNTKAKGGVLNWFGTGNLVKEFEAAAFGLQKKGDISTPFKTRFGWHIVKLLDKKSIEPLEEIRGRIESKISRDSRSKVKKEQTLTSLKSQNDFELDYSVLDQVIGSFDTTLLEGKWQIDSTEFTNQTIFSLGGQNYSSWDFSDFVNKKQRKRQGVSVTKYAESLYNQFEEKSIFEFEEKNLETNNKEYRMVLGEYRDGILLFNLMEKEVWGKAVEDTVGLKAYYKSNQDEYEAKESAIVRFFVSDKQEVIEKAKPFLDKTKNEIDKAFNKEEPLNLQVFDKTVEKGEDSDIDNYWKVGVYDFEKDNRKYLLQVQEIVPKKYKPLNTIKGQVISDYQNYLEETWVSGLKSKYPVKINKSSLKQFIKKTENRL